MVFTLSAAQPKNTEVICGVTYLTTLNMKKQLHMGIKQSTSLSAEASITGSDYKTTIMGGDYKTNMDREQGIKFAYVCAAYMCADVFHP